MPPLFGDIMTTLTSHAERQSVDLSRFVFTCGQIGRLKTVDITHVLPGDGFECDMVGSFRLSPLRRGLALDTKLEFFTFFIPYRYITDNFEQMVTEGPEGSQTLSTLNILALGPGGSGYLGVRPSDNGLIPEYMARAYASIYNNFFKIPDQPDHSFNPTNWNGEEPQNGLAVAHLKNYWTAPLPASYESTADVAIDTTGGTMDIRDFALATANLHQMQERGLFSTRYRDQIDAWGGSAPLDTDQRPELIQRTQMWASGYDVNGTTDTSMGQFSGRIQQSFSHKVPRYFVREHGIIMTVCVPRFPPIHDAVVSYEVGMGTALDYARVCNDPTQIGALGHENVQFSRMFIGGDPSQMFKMAYGQHYRVAGPDYVDHQYVALDGYPFITPVPSNPDECVIINSNDYDEMFQTDQLFHWNIQMKTNVQCQRFTVTTRDTLMVGD